MKDKDILSIVVAALCVIICIIIIVIFQVYSALMSELVNSGGPIILPVSRGAVKEPVIYDMQQDRQPGDTVSSVKKVPCSLGEVYQNFPKKDVGDNIVEKWDKVSPEQKASVVEGLDKAIEQCRDDVQKNPANADLKHKLFMTETMKKMVSENFNFNITELISSQDAQGSLSGDKK